MIENIRNGLIVSCQAPIGSPLRKPGMMREFALAVEAGGAVAIRAEGVENIKEIVAAVKVPVVGLIKRTVDNSPIYISPELSDIEAIKDAGAEIIAFDATLRPRSQNLNLEQFIFEAKRLSGQALLMADIDDFESGVIAANAGADLVSTTLSGYTNGNVPQGPDLELIKKLTSETYVPIVAEGRFTQPSQVKEALTAGAWAVCVGKAITDPWGLTKDFVKAIS